MDVAELEGKSVEELLAFYNTHAGRKLKKFADHPTAVKKVTDLLAKMAEAVAAKEARDATGLADPRSAGVALSWKNPEVAAKRKERSRVEVDGIVYKSVADAFRQLGLPMTNHIKFRQELKANGTDEEWGHKWTILPGDAAVTAPKLVTTKPAVDEAEAEADAGAEAETV